MLASRGDRAIMASTPRVKSISFCRFGKLFSVVRPLIACCLLGTIVLNSFHCVAHGATRAVEQRRDTADPDGSSDHCESGCLCRGVVSYAPVELPAPAVNYFESPPVDLYSVAWFGVEHAEVISRYQRSFGDGPPLARQTLRAHLQSFLL